MRGEDFSHQDLHGRNFRGQDLRNCRFIGTDLRDADLREANLSHADFTNADLTGAKMLGCIMHKTRGACRNGGPIVSITGLQYPILLDGTFITFGCATLQHKGRESLDRATLLRMDKGAAVRFHDLGAALLAWYRGGSRA